MHFEIFMLGILFQKSYFVSENVFHKFQKNVFEKKKFLNELSDGHLKNKIK